MRTKENKKYYTITFPLATDRHAEDILNKRLRIACNLYNELMAIEKAKFCEYKNCNAYKRAAELLKARDELLNKTSQTKEEKEQLKKLKAEIKEAYSTLQKKYEFSEFDFYKRMTKLYKVYKNHIDSSTAQSIAKRVWDSFDKCLYRDGKSPRFKKLSEFNSVTSMKNKAGIRVKDEQLIWKKLIIPIKVDKTNLYEVESYNEDKIVYPIIVRKAGKFYVRILFEGEPYQKNRICGVGTVNVRIGTKHIYITTEDGKTVTRDLPDLSVYKSKIVVISSKMDASKRAMNPNKYNSDGTIRQENKDKWVFSKRYNQLLAKKREIERKQAEYRRQQCYILVNDIIAMGDKIVIVKPNFSHIKLKRAELKKTAQNQEERNKQRTEAMKRRDIQDFAPGEFVQLLKNKAQQYSCEVIETSV